LIESAVVGDVKAVDASGLSSVSRACISASQQVLDRHGITARKIPGSRSFTGALSDEGGSRQL